MKIYELINILSNLPSDSEVLVSEGYYYTSPKIEIHKGWKQSNDTFLYDIPSFDEKYKPDIPSEDYVIIW